MKFEFASTFQQTFACNKTGICHRKCLQWTPFRFQKVFCYVKVFNGTTKNWVCQKSPICSIVLPVLITVVWSGGMAVEGKENCWDDYPNHAITYILIVPMILALVVNLIFLINIVRIIVTKLRNQPSLSTQQLQVSRIMFRSRSSKSIGVNYSLLINSIGRGGGGGKGKRAHVYTIFALF